MQKTNRRWSRIRQDERPTFAAVMLFVLVLPLMPAIAPACTSFGICQGTNIVVGNNDDWFSFSACLVVNKRDITDAEVERLIQYPETMEYVAVAGK